MAEDARWDELLLTMSASELNRWLKQHPLSSDDRQSLREARRRRKNRGYAQKSRARRMDEYNELSAEKEDIESEVQSLRDQVAQLRADNAARHQRQATLLALCQQHGIIEPVAATQK